ncbi:hydrogenase-4 subunit E [Leptospira ognonensis]|uniref:Hydrogenase-4 subunit E n=1 Tax=Leptospira ognonensis TaxID=2484945 RepID=A0A4R9JZ00_9LEPT|nr:hydrogenase-4 subunit E [Leptospira ognonensis]TGL57944.1 hydrogenase-4 subunit E [Leptospira ognonensis]
MSKPTGLFHSQSENVYYQFILEDQSIRIQKVTDKKSPIDYLMDEKYPIWMLRHSLGSDMGPEDYSLLPEEDYLTEKRSKVLGLHQRSGHLRDLFFHGLRVPCSEQSYSHAVGPIHAGIIEPGHFRFVVEGEKIRHLTIRLGFQKRNIINELKKSNLRRVMHLSETISGDTSVSYALAFAKIYEEAAGIQVSESVSLFRSLLIEAERIAIHIGDLGGLAEDIGYYPLYGVCVTDRGAALALMENWTGNRFGKGAVRPGGVRVNLKISYKDAKQALQALKNTFLKNIEPQIKRALADSTIKERLQECGNVKKEDVDRHGFVGMTARCAGVLRDIRLRDVNYPEWEALPLHEEKNNYSGDAWSRFYIRYAEIKQSLSWMEKTIEKIDWEQIWTKEQIKQTLVEIQCKPGLYFQSVEAWRGPLIVALKIDEKSNIEEAYIRDPSVLNWHALEMAVRGELIGDFPLNNKSFNLSYVGFDL